MNKRQKKKQKTSYFERQYKQWYKYFIPFYVYDMVLTGKEYKITSKHNYMFVINEVIR